MKTIQEYLNDPRMLNDPYMAGALESVKELHAIRLKIQDETDMMPVRKKIEFLNKEAEDFLSPLGKSLCYDLEGAGKMKHGIAVS